MRLIPKGWPTNLAKSIDRKFAWLFGFSGKHTLSAECAVSECELCKLMCTLLSLIESDHCIKVAKREGLIGGTERII